MTESRRCFLACAQPSHFGSIRGWRDATASRWFLPHIFCLLLCLQGAVAAQTLETWTGSTGDALWSDGKNWTPPTKSGGPSGNFDVVIPHINGVPGPILAVEASIVDLQIDANAGMTITNSSALTITGTIIENNGQLVMADVAGFNSGGFIRVDNTTILSGSGKTIFNSPHANSISGNGTLINQQTINGQAGGQITVALQNVGPNGTITGGPSTRALTIYGAVTNSGLISGLGFSTVVLTNTVQNEGGTIDATPSGQVLLGGCTIIGGTIGSAAAIAPLVGRSPTLSGVTITGTYSVTSTATLANSTTIEETITNNGQILVTSPAGGKAATLSVDGAVSLAGTGQVIMSGPNASITGEGSHPSVTNISPHVISEGNITGLFFVSNEKRNLQSRDNCGRDAGQHKWNHRRPSRYQRWQGGKRHHHCGRQSWRDLEWWSRPLRSHSQR